MTIKLIGILLGIWMLTVAHEIRIIKNRLDRLEEGTYKKGENKI